jgi:hypothetical protein
VSEAMFFALYAITGTVATALICYIARRGYGYAPIDAIGVFVLGPLIGLPFAAVVLVVYVASTDVLIKPRWFLRR